MIVIISWRDVTIVDHSNDPMSTVLAINIHLANCQLNTQYQQTWKHLTQESQRQQTLHAALECQEVEEKTFSSTAEQDTSKSDHDAVLDVYTHSDLLSSDKIMNVFRQNFNMLHVTGSYENEQKCTKNQKWHISWYLGHDIYMESRDWCGSAQLQFESLRKADAVFSHCRGESCN